MVQNKFCSIHPTTFNAIVNLMLYLASQGPFTQSIWALFVCFKRKPGFLGQPNCSELVWQKKRKNKPRALIWLFPNCPLPKDKEGKKKANTQEGQRSTCKREAISKAACWPQNREIRHPAERDFCLSPAVPSEGPSSLTEASLDLRMFNLGVGFLISEHLHFEKFLLTQSDDFER